MRRRALVYQFFAIRRKVLLTLVDDIAIRLYIDTINIHGFQYTSKLQYRFWLYVCGTRNMGNQQEGSFLS
jgi:hypothetical protein